MIKQLILVLCCVLCFSCESRKMLEKALPNGAYNVEYLKNGYCIFNVSGFGITQKFLLKYEKDRIIVYIVGKYGELVEIK